MPAPTARRAALADPPVAALTLMICMRKQTRATSEACRVDASPDSAQGQPRRPLMAASMSTIRLDSFATLYIATSRDHIRQYDLTDTSPDSMSMMSLSVHNPVYNLEEI